MPDVVEVAGSQTVTISDGTGSSTVVTVSEGHSVTVSELTEIISGGGGTWGSITGTLSDQTDLQAELDLKADQTSISNIDNTSDLGKPVSTAQQTALDLKENTITATTSADYYRGDKTFQTLDKTAVGLGNVDNTADSAKPVSTAQQTALDLKENAVTGTTSADYYRGDKTFQTLDKTAVGLGSVDNTSDADKPVSTATQTELDLKADLIKSLTLTIAGSNVNVVDLTGYDATDADVEVRIEGTVSADFTITMPPVTSTKRKYTFKEAEGNGFSNPDYVIKLIPSGADSIDNSHLDLSGSYELSFDYEGVSFISNFSNTKWEAVAMSHIQLFGYNEADVYTRGGKNLVADKTISGTSGDTPVANANDGNDFQNIGASLDQVGNYFENAVLEGTDLANGLAGGNYTTTINAGTGTSEEFFDNDANSIGSGTGGSCAVSADFEVDLGSAQTIDGLRVNGPDNGTPDANGNDCQFFAKTLIGDAWTLMTNFHVPGTVAGFHGTGGAGGVASEFIFTPFSAQYVRCVIGALRNNDCSRLGINVFEQARASSNNTADAKMVIASAQQFATASTLIKDENGAEVGDSTVNCIEVVGGVAGNGGVLVDYGTYKTRGLLASSANVQVRIQPVGTQKVQSVQMTTVASNMSIVAGNLTGKVAGVDTLTLTAGGVLNGRDVSADGATLDSHVADAANPHGVTATQVGLGSVDNTSDLGKPVSTAQQTALDLKENTITGTTSADYYRGDKTFQTLDKTAVGLGNVDNTADSAKPVSTAQQTALDLKENAVTGTTSADYYRGDKTFQTLDKTAVGLGSVDNTSDLGKPVSTATQTALDGKQDSALIYIEDGVINKALAYDIGRYWTKVEIGASYENVHSVLNMGEGRVLCGVGTGSGEGVVFKSTDYGDTWAVKTVDAGGSLTAVYSLSYAGRGIVFAGCHGIDGLDVYKSTDYGDTWAGVNFGIGYDVVFSGAYLGNGVALFGLGVNLSRGKILKITGFGVSSTSVNTVDSNLEAIFSVCNLGGGRALCGAGASTGDGAIYKSTNSGDTWTRVSLPDSASLEKVASIVDLGNDIVLCGSGESGGDGDVWRSTDNGDSFTKVEIGASYEVVHALCNFGNGIVLGGVGTTLGDGDIIKSIDYGLTWELIATPESVNSVLSIENLGDGIALIGTGSATGAGDIYKAFIF